MGNTGTSTQTGMPRGTWKRRDKHPTVEGRIFKQYVTRRGVVRERWVTQDMLDAYAATDSRYKASVYVPRPLADYQTGSEKGTYRMWEEHPEHKGMFFKQYTTNRGDSIKEYWVSEERMKEMKVYTRIYNSHRERHAAMGKLSKEDARQINMLYKIRNIKNTAHGRVVYHVDHIIPVAKGGLHHPSNLQLATATWNLRKGTNIYGGKK